MTANLQAVSVVSPQFPCGAAWLANAFIELGIAPSELWGFDTAGEWESEGQGTWRYAAAHQPWRQTLPSLEPGRRYAIDPRWNVRFSHLFPWQREPARRVILVVRDPRDVLYSEWRRQLRNGELPASAAFADFIAAPFHGGPITNADLLWLHLSCWLHRRAADPQAFHLLRFEDWKHDDRAALSGVCEWLGMETAPETIARACAASDVRRLLAVEERIEREDPAARRFNRAGMAQEWLLRWEPAMHRLLGPHWAQVFQALGYRPGPASGVAGPHFDTRRVLAWRDPISAADAGHWAALIDAAKTRVAAATPP